MVTRNLEIAKLQSNYLFVEIANRKRKLIEQNPKAKVISLGIGDTTEPLSEVCSNGFIQKAKDLALKGKYTGYGPDFGEMRLREKIAEKLYQNRVLSSDIFISDGAKCDLGRLQLLFGRNATVTIQDPSYPVYIGASVMSGKTQEFNLSKKLYEGIVYMPCRPENQFFGDLSQMPRTDLIYICSPNNPTGSVLDHAQLKSLVDIAKKRESIIIYDAAYSGFIRNLDLPRSIYEIEGAKEVAIEINSFSKLAGFTGVRLGFSIIPKELRFSDGTSVQEDWIKIITTFFNGASNLAQAGGIAALTDEGLKYSYEISNYYLKNAKRLKSCLTSIGYDCFGGDNAPYIWVDLKKESSWKIFDLLLHKAHLVTTPGVGFGPSGEGFLRLSSFGNDQDILEATERLIDHMPTFSEIK